MGNAERRTQNAERGRQNAERAPGRRLRLCAALLVVLTVLIVLVCGAPPALGAPTQDEFFRSMHKTREVNPPSVPSLPKAVNSTPLLLAAAGLLALLLLIGVRRNRRAARPPQPLNSRRKLAREVARRVPLSARQWRQVKAAADRQGCESAITLLLCPSLLARAAHDADGKLDRKTLSDVARKLIGNG